MQLELFPEHDQPLAKAPPSHELPVESVETALEILVRLIAQATEQQPVPQEHPDEQ